VSRPFIALMVVFASTSSFFMAFIAFTAFMAFAMAMGCNRIAAVEGALVEGGAVEGALVEGGAVEGGAVEGAAVEGVPADVAVEGAAVEGVPADVAVEGAAVEGGAVEGAAVEGAAVEGVPPVSASPFLFRRSAFLAFSFSSFAFFRTSFVQRRNNVFWQGPIASTRWKYWRTDGGCFFARTAEPWRTKRLNKGTDEADQTACQLPMQQRCQRQQRLQRLQRPKVHSPSKKKTATPPVLLPTPSPGGKKLPRLAFKRNAINRNPGDAINRREFFVGRGYL
jgi:hypothetical protein